MLNNNEIKSSKKDNSENIYLNKIKLEGIVISSKKYKERGAIIHLLTPKGMVCIFGNSYKSPKSKYHVLNNLFLKVDLQGMLDKNNIFKIKDMNIKTYKYVNFFNLEESKILFKIINILKRNEHNNYEIYKTFDNIIKNLNNKENQEIYLYYFICQILKQNLIELDFKKCMRCKSTTNFKTLSILEGGFICQNCYRQEFIMDIKEIKNIKILFLNNPSNLDRIHKINIQDKTKKELENLLNESLGIYIV